MLGYAFLSNALHRANCVHTNTNIIIYYIIKYNYKRIQIHLCTTNTKTTVYIQIQIQLCMYNKFNYSCVDTNTSTTVNNLGYK